MDFVVVHPLLGVSHIVYWILCWVHVLWCSVSHPRGAVLGLRSVIVTLSAIAYSISCQQQSWWWC